MLSNLEAQAGIYIPKQTNGQLANELHITFPKALREVLKDDFEKGGKAFAGMVLSMFGEMRSAIADQKAATLLQLDPQERLQADASLQAVIQRLDQLAALQVGTEETKRELQNLLMQMHSGFRGYATDIPINITIMQI